MSDFKYLKVTDNYMLEKNSMLEIAYQLKRIADILEVR